MRKIAILAALLLPSLALAHGVVPDGHEESLSVADYAQLGGIVLASAALIRLSVKSIRK